MRRSTERNLLFMSLLLALSAGCTFTGTTEAIFDATSDITVSTSGRIWWSEDGLLKSEYKAVAFAAYNRRSLEQDLARGHGEYLASLGSLLGVQENFRPAFEAAAQQHFDTMVPRDRMIQLQQLHALVE